MQSLEQRLDPNCLLFLKWGQDPFSFCPFWPNACLLDKGVQEHSSTQSDCLPNGGHFSGIRLVMSDPLRGWSPGGPVAGTMTLVWLGQALTIRGHCIYVMLHPVYRSTKYPWGLPVLKQLIRLLRLGMNLTVIPEWLCKMLTPCGSVQGAFFQQICTLLRQCRRTQRMQGGTEIFFFSSLWRYMEKKGKPFSAFLPCTVYCLTVCMHARTLVLFSDKANC